MKIRQYILVFLLASLFTWCSDPYEDEVFAAYEDEPIALYLENSEDFTLWAELLKKADLFNALNLNLDYTCFVADNDAVMAYLKSKGWNSVDDLTETEASNLMRYHIIPGSIYYYPALSGKIPANTASGDYLTVSVSIVGDDDVRSINDVKILNTGRFSDPLINGLLHQIEEVLDPVIYTVWNLIEMNPEYSLFAEALKEAGLDTYLNTRDIEVNEVMVRDFKTVFTVTNSTFAESGIMNINDLKQRFPGDPKNTSSDFYKFMAYKILARSMSFGELSDFLEGAESIDGLKGTNVLTYADKEFITVSDINSEIYINPDDEIQIIHENIPANNGYLHEIDNIMTISDPIQFGFVWEPTDWDEFRSIPFYKNGGWPIERHYFTEPTDHIRWKSIPSGMIEPYYETKFIQNGNWLNNDGFYADFLVPVGWIEFDTPQLMRGKYRIEMKKWNYWNWGAKFQMYIDGEKFGPVIPMHGGDSWDADLGVYEFEESGEHVFRFRLVATDGTAMFAVDHFKFTPVK